MTNMNTKKEIDKKKNNKVFKAHKSESLNLD